MANNRIYLRCKGCGKEFFLGKRFADAYYIGEYPQYKKPFRERLDDFYSEHFYCGDCGPDCFEINYEMEAEC